MLTIQARTTREVAEAELVRLIGAPPGTPIEPAVSLGDSPSARGPQALAALARASQTAAAGARRAHQADRRRVRAGNRGRGGDETEPSP